MTKKSIIPEWLRLSDAAYNYGISRSGIYRLAAGGEIELRKIGARTVVNVSSLRSFIERQPQLKPRQNPKRQKLGFIKFSSKTDIQNRQISNKISLPLT